MGPQRCKQKKQRTKERNRTGKKITKNKEQKITESTKKSVMISYKDAIGLDQSRSPLAFELAQPVDTACSANHADLFLRQCSQTATEGNLDARTATRENGNNKCNGNRRRLERMSK